MFRNTRFAPGSKITERPARSVSIAQSGKKPARSSTSIAVRAFAPEVKAHKPVPRQELVSRQSTVKPMPYAAVMEPAGRRQFSHAAAPQRAPVIRLTHANIKRLLDVQPIFQKRHSSSSTGNQQSSGDYIPPHIVVTVQNQVSNFGVVAYLLMLGLMIYLISLSLKPRESEITDTAIDLEKNPHHGMIVDSSRFEHAGDKAKGELSGEIVRDKLTGFIYLKKGAESKDTLIKEFVASRWLALLRPGEQPDALILQECHDDGTARFYTLSRIYDNSMDLEEFIKRGDWREKLAKKPLIGLDVAIAADFLLAKNQDTKLANYIVIETEKAYVAACIDHEKWDASLLYSCAFLAYINLDLLKRHFVDLTPAGQEYRVGLWEQPKEVEAFLAEAVKFMSMQHVEEFYRKVAALDIAPIMHSIADIHRSHGHQGIITDSEEMRYANKLLKIKDQAELRELNFEDHPEHKPAAAGMKL